MNSDPFLITGPTLLANSGGATSGYNLRRHLDANGGLPPFARCVFTNTGWEDERTFDFLCEQSRRWAIEIVWLEFCWRPATADELARLESKWQAAADREAQMRAKPARAFAKAKRPGQLLSLPAADHKREAVRKATRYAEACFHSWRKAELIGVRSYRIVTRETAAVDGRPYHELLEGLERFRRAVKNAPGVLPNGVQRICTGELKVKVMAAYAADALGVPARQFDARLGLRADEDDRLKNAQEWDKCGGRAVFPLDAAGVVKADVAEFWSRQPFRLTVKAHEGNCGGCFMKRRAALLDLIRRNQFDPAWWSEWEKRTGQRFRSERSFAGLIEAARSERELFAPPGELDNGITCEGGYCSN